VLHRSSQYNLNNIYGSNSKKEVDFIAAGLTVTYARSTVIGLTYPFDDDENALLIPYPELDITGNIDAVAKPFQYEVRCLYTARPLNYAYSNIYHDPMNFVYRYGF